MPSKASATAAGESATLPQNRLSANSASRAAAIARYAIVRRFVMCIAAPFMTASSKM